MLSKKTCPLVLVTILAVVCPAQFNVAYAAVGTTVDTGEVLAFLKDVVQLDSPASPSTEPSHSTDSNYYTDNSNSSLTKLEPEVSSTKPFPTVPVAAISVPVALAIAGLLVYFKKHSGVKEQM